LEVLKVLKVVNVLEVFNHRIRILFCNSFLQTDLLGTPLEQEHNKEIEEATHHLHNILVPKFARELKIRMGEARNQGVLHQFRLTETAHSFGVNCRHFGEFFSYS
jgi:hypothetical protein